MAKSFERNSTKITISEFYDNYKLGKYNFDAAYQRKGGVWSEDKQSFLIDSILKNYPVPAFFMRPIVDDNGRTIYDIIDGKQRLQSIIKFIEDEIKLTSYFGEDIFFPDSEREKAEELAEKTFSEIKRDKSAGEYVKQFWTYALQVEYLYEEDNTLVSSVFDRLNRNGEPLNRQELRNAKYGSSIFLRTIRELSQIPFFHDKLERLKIERMEDEEFVSELLILILDGEVQDSSPQILDDKYEEYKDDKDNIDNAKKVFTETINFMEDLELDFDRLKRLSWTTHLYTLFSVCWYCTTNGILVKNIQIDVKKFYDEYFSKSTDYIGTLQEYKSAATSRTRSSSQRKNRMNAILKYCKLLA